MISAGVATLNWVIEAKITAELPNQITMPNYGN